MATITRDVGAVRLTRIPEREVERFAVDHDGVAVVVEHGGDIVTREGVGRVGDQEARLPNSSVSNSHYLQVLHLHRPSFCEFRRQNCFYTRDLKIVTRFYF